MDKNFLYIMLGVAIILIAVLTISQNNSSKQPADIMNDLLLTPTVSIDFNQQSTKNNVTPKITQGSSTTSAIRVLEGGLRMQDLVIGTGEEVKSGDYIVIHYKGVLENGTQFDSSYDRGQPFETQIGVGQVIKGWDIGVIGMKIGGKRVLEIPAALAYQDQQVGNIPPNSTLIFQVELISINANK